jgi:hypothetical protein
MAGGYRAHSLEIAVLFDVVLNHGSSKKNTLWNWDGFGPDGCGGIYFEGEKDTPWGKRFAFHKAEVQDYLKQSCRTWIEEYGVDGLRFDSVHNMPWHLLQQLTNALKEHYPDKIVDGRTCSSSGYKHTFTYLQVCVISICGFVDVVDAMCIDSIAPRIPPGRLGMLLCLAWGARGAIWECWGSLGRVLGRSCRGSLGVLGGVRKEY